MWGIVRRRGILGELGKLLRVLRMYSIRKYKPIPTK